MSNLHSKGYNGFILWCLNFFNIFAIYSVDVRNPDASKEPGDQKSLAVAGLPSESFRPQAVSLIYDRDTSSMPLPEVQKDTPIITHCGGGEYAYIPCISFY